MRKNFIGFLFVFLDFTLNFGNVKFGLIPDFVGYIIMIDGLLSLAGESPFFVKVKPFATGMAVYTGVLYVMDLVGVSASLGFISYAFAIASTILSLYISYCILMGVKDMETNYSASLNGDALKSTWNILAVFNIAAFIVIVLPTLAFVCILVSFIAAVCFLVSFNRSKNLFEEIKNRQADSMDRPNVNP